jgi:hypothetical protein
MTARDRTVILVVAIVAAVAGSWMLLISPKRKQAASLGTQITSVQGQLATAQATVAKGLAARNQYASNYTQLARLGEALPGDDQVPSLIYELQSAATASHIAFRNLQMTPASGSGTTASSGSSSLPPGAATGPAGLPVEQFSFDFTGNFFRLSDFFHRLQSFVVAGKTEILVSGRLLTVNAISFAPGPKGFPQIAATVSATTYMAPANGGITGGATPSGPTPSTKSPSAPSGSSAAAAVISPPIR